jgi:hypothetical protein
VIEERNEKEENWERNDGCCEVKNIPKRAMPRVRRMPRELLLCFAILAMKQHNFYPVVWRGAGKSSRCRDEDQGKKQVVSNP